MSPSPFAVSLAHRPRLATAGRPPTRASPSGSASPIEQVLRFDLNTSPAPPALLAGLLAAGRFETDALGVPAGRLPPPRRSAAADAYGVAHRRARRRAPARTRSSTCAPRRSCPPGEAAIVSIPTYAMYRIHAEQRGGARRSPSRAGRASGWAMDLPAVREPRPRAADARLGLQPEQPDRPAGARRRDRDAARRARGRRRPRTGAPRRPSSCDEAYSEFTGQSVIGLRRPLSRTSSPSARPRRPTRWPGCGSGFAVGAAATIRRVAPVPAAGLDRHRLRDRRGRGAARPRRRCAPTSNAWCSERAAARGGARGRRAGARSRRSRTSSCSTSGRRSAPRRPSIALMSPRPRAAHVRARPPARPLPARHRARPATRTTASSRRPARSRRPCPPPRGDRRMTTPLGTLEVRAATARRVRVARRTRETDIDRRPRPRRHRRRGDRDRHRVLRPPARLARPPRAVRPRDPRDRATSTSTSTTRSRTSRWSWARRSPRRSATGPGSAASATAPCPWTRRRDRGHRRRRAAVCRHRPAVPRASAPGRSRSSSSSTPSSRSPGPPGRRSTCAAPAATTTTSPRPRSRRSAARCASRASRTRGGPASPRRRDRWGDARPVAGPMASSSTTAPATSSRSSRRCSRPGPASVAARRRPSTCDGAALLVVPGRRGRGAGDGATASRRLRGADPRLDRRRPPVPRASASGSSSCSRAATRTARRRWASLAGRTVRLEDAPTLPHIGWNQVERRAPHPAFDGIADGADFYFVHSYVGRPDGGRRRRRARRRPSTAGRSCRPSPAGACWASSSTRSARATTACGWSRTSSCRVAAPPDAPPARDPLPRRRERPRRQGHPLPRPRRRGRPARARRALRPRGRRRARVPRHHRRARGPRRRCSTSSSGPRAGRSCR